MKNFVQKGNRLRLFPEESVQSGNVVIVGGLVGVAFASYDVAEGDGVICDLEGVYELPKTLGAWKQGDELFYDAAEKAVTVSEGGDFIGYAADVATAEAAIGLVRLKG